MLQHVVERDALRGRAVALWHAPIVVPDPLNLWMRAQIGLDLVELLAVLIRRIPRKPAVAHSDISTGIGATEGAVACDGVAGEEAMPTLLQLHEARQRLFGALEQLRALTNQKLHSCLSASCAR